MAQDQPVPSVVFDIATLEPRHRRDAWQSFYQGLFDIRSLARTDDSIGFKAQSWRVGNVALHNFSYHSPVLAVGGTRRENTAEDLVLFCINLAGNIRANVDGALVDFKPRAVHVIDRSRSFRIVSEKRDVLVLGVPNANVTIGYEPSRHPAHRAHDFDAPLGNILRANIEAMFETLPTTNADAGFALADGLCGLLKAIVTGDMRDETVRHHFERGRAGALMRYIDQNLRDPNLSVDRICQDIGLSRRTLYRLFAAEGGVARHILKRRLESALVELGQSPPSRGLINAVALRWAFPDQAAFARQFRARFGFPPGDAIGSLGLMPGAAGSSRGQSSSVTGIRPLISLLG